MVVDKIQEYLMKEDKTVDEAVLEEVSALTKHCFKRQFMESQEEKKSLRLSSAGKCARQQAYKLHGFPVKGKEIDMRAKMTFWMGDVTELSIVSLAKAAGVRLSCTGLEQKEIEFDVDGTKITGHPDGIILDDECKLLEVKSMSSFGYKKFDAGEIDSSYIAQMNLYMECLGVKECILVALNKDAGVLGEMSVYRSDSFVRELRKNLRDVLKSTPDSLPDGWFGPDAKKFYPWNCLYCGYHGHCKPNAKKVLAGRSYKLKEGG